MIFPSLQQGLYPPSHGIIANKFYDPQFRAEFRLGRQESFKARWWGGEPIWKTVEKQVQYKYKSCYVSFGKILRFAAKVFVRKGGRECNIYGVFISG